MPIIANQRPGTEHKHLSVCDFCGAEIGFVSDEYVQYSGHVRGKPKFNLTCHECYEYGWNHGFQPGFIIKGLGRVTKEFLVEHNIIELPKPPKQKKVDALQIQWPAVDQMITDGNCKLTILAKSLGINPVDLRKKLMEHYSDRIVFKAGRTGGIYWSTPPQSK